MRKYLDDVFIFLGCGLIVYATYRISLTAAIYAGGILLICLGIYLGMVWKAVSK